VLYRWFESDKIWAAGLIVGEICEEPSHWNSAQTLSSWMEHKGVPGLCGIDTRALTKHIRSKGSMLAKIIVTSHADRDHVLDTLCSSDFPDPNLDNLVSHVSIPVCSTLTCHL